MALALALHLFGTVVWVGGMLVMLLVVRPTAIKQLEPPQRLAFLSGCLARFFPWVWGAVVILPLSGYWLLFSLYGSFANAPHYLHAMQGLGLIMAVIFLWVVGVTYPHLRAALAKDDIPLAARSMERIRLLITVNAVLGVVVVGLGGAARYLN